MLLIICDNRMLSSRLVIIWLMIWLCCVFGVSIVVVGMMFCVSVVISLISRLVISRFGRCLVIVVVFSVSVSSVDFNRIRWWWLK